MDTTFPILHVESLKRNDPGGRGELSVSELAGLGRRLHASAFATPAAPFLMAGWSPAAGLEAPGLFVTHETRREPMAYWCSNIGARGFSSILAVTPDEFTESGGVSPRDIPLLTGHGVVVASGGLTGAPLVGMEVSELRRELTESRRRLSEACGYPVRGIVPATTVAGRAFDGLVEREARRAGYTLLFGPGAPATLGAVEPDLILTYRTRQSGEDASALRDWLLGRGFSRESARLRRLASTPGAILDRLAPKS